MQHPAPLAANAAGVLRPRAAPACLVALCEQGGQCGHRHGGAACTQCLGSTGRTPTYQHTRGGSCSARPHSSHHRTRHRRGHHSPGCRRRGRCHGVCHHHRIAHCHCRAAGAHQHRLHGKRPAGWQPGQGAAARGPLQPCQHPTHPTVTHTGSPGRRCRVGSKASACPHTAIGKSQGAAAAWGGRDTTFRPRPSPCAPCHPHVPVPRLTHGTTTALRAPHSAPAVGGR